MTEDQIISIFEIQTNTLSKLNDIVELINQRLDALENSLDAIEKRPKCMCMNRYGGELIN